MGYPFGSSPKQYHMIGVSFLTAPKSAGWPFPWGFGAPRRGLVVREEEPEHYENETPFTNHRWVFMWTMKATVSIRIDREFIAVVLIAIVLIPSSNAM